MARINIFPGTNANDGTGDDLRSAMISINTNFTELYAASPVSSQITIAGNKINANASNADLVLEPSGTGAIVLPAITINDNNITGTRSNENLNITASGTGHIVVGALRINGTTISADDSSAINFAESNITLGSINITGNVISSTDSTVISFSGQQLSGVGQPTQATDVATKSYVDSSGNNFGNLEIVDDTLQNIVTNNHLKLDTVGTGLIKINSETFISSSSATVASSAATAMDTFLQATFRSGKYLVSITDTTNSRYEIAEVIVTHNGSTGAYISVYGRAGSTATDLATFSATADGTTCTVQVVNAAGSSTTYKFFRTLIPV